MIRSTLWKSKPSNDVARPWVLVFAIWIALILPLLAFRVSSFAGQPVVNVESEQITNPAPASQEMTIAYRGESNPSAMLDRVDHLGTWQSLEMRAVLDPNAATRAAAADALARTHEKYATAAGVPISEWQVQAVAPNDPNTIVIATRRDLLVSHDRGQTWNHLKNVLPSILDDLVISPANTNVLYAGVDSLGFYTSVDGGKTWRPTNIGLPVTPGARFGVSAIAVDPDNTQRIFIAAGVWLGSGQVKYQPLGIYTTTNAGRTWTKLKSDTAHRFDRLFFNNGTLQAWSGG